MNKKFSLTLICLSFVLLFLSAGPALAQAPGTITTIDNSPYAIDAMQVNRQGLPIIAYKGASLVFCHNVTCTDRSSKTFQDPTGAGHGLVIQAMQLKGGQLPVIVYELYPQPGLIVCYDPYCNFHTNTILDFQANGYELYRATVTLAPSGLPIIAFYDIRQHKIVLAWCSDAQCQGPLTFRAVAQPKAHPFDLELVLNPSGLPQLVYHDSDGQGYIYLLTCDDPHCINRTTSQIDKASQLGFNTELRLNQQGLPVISYIVRLKEGTQGVDSAVGVVMCADTRCQTKHRVYLNADKPKGFDLSLALSPDDRPIISYDTGHLTQDLMLTACLDPLCNQATTTLIDAQDEAGDSNFLGLDAQGLPLIAYREDLNQELKLYTPTLSQGRVELDHPTGRPGSRFSLTGTTLTPTSSATVSINGVTLGQPLQTNGQGLGTLTLDTSQADPGFYSLEIRLDNGFGGQFMKRVVLQLDPQAPLRAGPPSGTISIIPAGIARTPQHLYLPYLSRR